MPDAEFNDALALHRAGDLVGAAVQYQRVLDANPSHAGALHFLGMIYLAQNEPEKAEPLVAKSVKLEPKKATYQNNYGVVLIEIKRFSDAKFAFETALSINPEYVDALV
ncbi:MAG: tetratricopeptide repeat protein, partial [Thermoguttaceae bacterium]